MTEVMDTHPQATRNCLPPGAPFPCHMVTTSSQYSSDDWPVISERKVRSTNHSRQPNSELPWWLHWVLTKFSQQSRAMVSTQGSETKFWSRMGSPCTMIMATSNAPLYSTAQALAWWSLSRHSVTLQHGSLLFSILVCVRWSVVTSSSNWEW